MLCLWQINFSLSLSMSAIRMSVSGMLAETFYIGLGLLLGYADRCRIEFLWISQKKIIPKSRNFNFIFNLQSAHAGCLNPWNQCNFDLGPLFPVSRALASFYHHEHFPDCCLLFV